MLNDIKQKTFEDASKHILNCWTALSLAVHHEWGGRKSEALRTVLHENIIELFKTNKNVSSELLEDLLFYFMDTNFNTELEDNSECEVAQKLLDLHKALKENNSSVIDCLMNAAPISLQSCKSISVDCNAESDTDIASDNTLDHDADINLVK